MLKNTLILIGALSCFGQPATTAFSGLVSGKVIGEDGNAVAGAYVTMRVASSHPVGRLRQTEWGGRSGVDGSFRFDGVTDGSYGLCVQAAGSTWLDPCEWGLPVASVAVSVANRNQNITITLRKGIGILIRVDDAAGLLTQYEGGVTGAQLLIGLSRPASPFRNAVLISQDAAGRTYQVVVPFNFPARLLVASPFRLTDGAGNSLSSPTTISLPAVPPSQPPPSVKLVVRGKP